MLLLHGYLSCKESFYYQIGALAEGGFRAVAPDMPGFGASSPLQWAWSVSDYASWLEKFIAAEKLAGAHVVAHSFGARVAFKLFSAQPQLLGKLIICGGAGLVKPRSPRYIRRVKRYRRVKKLFPAYAERKFGSEEYRSLSPLMRESYKKIVNEDLSDCARKILSPTLLVYGEDDAVTPFAEEGTTFNRLIGGSKLIKIGGGHFCFAENAEEFNPLMLGFLAE